jgi:hypothetical protein
MYVVNHHPNTDMFMLAERQTILYYNTEWSAVQQSTVETDSNALAEE